LDGIAIIYDRSQTDELGIRLTAEERGINLAYLPFHKVAIGFSNEGLSYNSLGKNYDRVLENSEVIVNRTQSKSRRLFASAILNALGKHVLNPFTVELACQSKIKTLATLYQNRIKIPKTLYIPCNVKEIDVNKGQRNYSKVISDLITSNLSEEKVVLKPDAGTHGRQVELVENKLDLVESLNEVETSIINPAGVLAQEFIQKWFFDLRIIVEKQRGKKAYCQPKALARGGFKEFRTNTFLGNMVFRAHLPSKVQNEAIRCGEALAGGESSWVVALDAMPDFGVDVLKDEQEIREYFVQLDEPFKDVLKVKADPTKKTNFPSYSRNIEDAYHSYMSTEAYNRIQEIIDESLVKKQDSVMFHEGNACPEFWEQTRIVAGVNVADSILSCAVSILDKGE
jgi:glutathione synthase/RimK-type ligase-like ATP-grasp enzyme